MCSPSTLQTHSLLSAPWASCSEGGQSFTLIPQTWCSSAKTDLTAPSEFSGSRSKQRWVPSAVAAQLPDPSLGCGLEALRGRERAVK
jgi:hypothetical protein